MKTTKTILFIHGSWMTPKIWEPFRRFFEAREFQVLTPAWPGIQGNVDTMRRDPSALAGLGLQEITDFYAKVIETLEEPPILIGHSMGGLVVQKLLDRGLGAVGVSIAGATPKGIFRVPLSVLKASYRVLANPRNIRRTLMLTFDQFLYAFANTLNEPAARELYDHQVIPAPGRPLFQAAFGNFVPRAANRVDYSNDDRAPLLLIAGSEDHIVPAELNRVNHRLYGHSTAITDYREFPGRSHLIIIENGWAEVAEFIQEWIQQFVRRPHFLAVAGA